MRLTAVAVIRSITNRHIKKSFLNTVNASQIKFVITIFQQIVEDGNGKQNGNRLAEVGRNPLENISIPKISIHNDTNDRSSVQHKCVIITPVFSEAR